LARIKLLLSRRGDPNWPNTNGFTPLGRTLGVFYSQRIKGTNWHDAVVLMLQHGARADSSVLGVHGFPPIYYAVQAKDLEVIKLMIQNGADPDEAFPPGPLIQAVTFADPEIVRFLLDKKVSLNRKDDHDRTALAIARAGGNQEIINMLKKAGAHE
jgi:ankyrin repeat protein